MDATGFGKTARGLSKNPLGIIALFIVLVYGFASLVLGFGSHLQVDERQPIIWFLVIFPVLVLGVFAWLVTNHHSKLYAPSDFGSDEAFVKLASNLATQALTAAVVNKARADANIDVASIDVASEVEAVRSTVHERVTAKSLARLRHSQVLWVDDKPEGNVNERNALEALGIRLRLARSTDEALSILQSVRVDAIISDIKRPENPQAGLLLLDKLRGSGYRAPFVVYTGYRDGELWGDARKRGALGITNRPEELLQLVLDAIKKGPNAGW